MLGTDSGGDVDLGVAVQPDLVDVRQEGIEQRVRAAVAAVLAAVLGERFARGRIDVLGGQEIGDTDREADDVATFGLEALGLLGHLHDRAGLGATDAPGKLRHGDVDLVGKLGIVTAQLMRRSLGETTAAI